MSGSLYEKLEPQPSGGSADLAGIAVERKTDFILSKRDEDTIIKLTTQMAMDQDSRVSRSHLIRAMCILLEHADEEIVAQARAVRLGRRPPNGNHMARRAYEHKIAAAISRALTIRGPIRA